MHDPSEAGRRERLAEIIAEPGQREALEAKYGPIWESQELNRDFEVLGFLAPYVLVRRRADGVKSPPNKSYQFWHSLCFINNA